VKRGFVFLGLLFIFNFSCVAQKIVSAIFANTEDDQIGYGSSADETTIMLFLSRLKDDLGYTLDPDPPLRFDFGNFTYKKFDDLENKFSTTGPEDIIIVYISSHGGRDQLNETPFPYILFDSLQNKRSVFDKFKSLQKLPHKCLLMAIDACNNYLDTSKISKEEVESKYFGKNYAPFIPRTITAHEKEVAHSIFISNCFDLCVTASNPPLISQTTYRGSLFTNSFISAFYDHYEYLTTEQANINSILKDAYTETLDESKRLYYNDTKGDLEHSVYSAPYHPVWNPIDPCVNKTTMTIFNDSISIIKTKIEIDTTSFKIDIRMSSPPTLRALRGVKKTVDIRIQAANKNLFDKIDQVIYYLPGFKEQNVFATDRQDHYHYRLFLFTNFYLRCKIILKDNQIINLSKNIIIDSLNIWSNKAEE